MDNEQKQISLSALNEDEKIHLVDHLSNHVNEGYSAFLAIESHLETLSVGLPEVATEAQNYLNVVKNINTYLEEKVKELQVVIPKFQAALGLPSMEEIQARNAEQKPIFQSAPALVH